MPETNRRRGDLGFLGALYITQYLGIGFFFTGFPAIMRNAGASLESIGAFYLLGVIWVLKFLWAPTVDNRSFGRLGHLKGWLMICQTGMIVGLLAMAAFPPPESVAPLVLLMLVVGVFAATQDIAADAWAVRMLSASERGLGNAYQTAGGLIGNLVGGGLVLVAYDWIGWAGSMVVLAVGTAIPLFMVASRTEPRTDADVEVRVTLADIWRTLRRPSIGGWLLTASFFFLGISLAYGLITPLLVDAGWSLTSIAVVLNVWGAVAGILGGWYGGRIVTRLGRKRALVLVAVAQAVSLAGLMVPISVSSAVIPVGITIGLVMAAYGANTTVLTTTLMDRSRPEYAGTDYTVQYSVLSIGGFLSAGLGLAVAGQIGYAGALAVAVALSLVCIPMALRRTDMEPAAVPAGV
jgi:MFS transporter, PAT family, beta-lactamase induction signal transducer AmpG